MTIQDPAGLLEMLRDPNRETQEIAAAAGASREDAARASRLVLGLGKAKPEDVLSLPTPLALAVLRAAAGALRADLVAAAAVHPSKEVAKEGKRTLYFLRIRGLAVPEPQRPPPPLPSPTPEPALPCFASTVDGHGERAVWIGRVIPGKGIEIGQAVISDQRGLTELHLGFLGRKEFRAFAKDLVARGQLMGVAEIERRQAKGLVSAARKLNEAAGTVPPEGADAWLSRLGPAEPPPDPAERFPPLPEAEERSAVEASGSLHGLPLVRGWLADEDLLRTLAHKLDEIAVSSLYIDERQRAQAAAGAVASAAEKELEGVRRALWSSRLFALAEHLDRAGDAEHARLAAASARALRAGISASLLPFARLLVEKAFPPREPVRGSASAPAPGALIVPPGT